MHDELDKIGNPGLELCSQPLQKLLSRRRSPFFPNGTLQARRCPTILENRFWTPREIWTTMAVSVKVPDSALFHVQKDDECEGRDSRKFNTKREN